MEEKKLTDEEIVKALEVCKDNKGCDACPCYIKNLPCITARDSDINTLLNFIHRLQSENERLKNYRDNDYKTMQILRNQNGELNDCMDELQDKNAELQKQVDELTEEILHLHKLLNEKRLEEFNFSKKIVAENAELQKQVDELTAFKNEAISMSLYGKGRKDGEEVAVKETTTEIIGELFYMASIHHSDVANILAWAKEKAKSKGVEVE